MHLFAHIATQITSIAFIKTLSKYPWKKLCSSTSVEMKNKFHDAKFLCHRSMVVDLKKKIYFPFYMSLIFVGAGGSGVSALVQLMIDLSFSDIICIDSVNSSHMDSFHQA